MFKSLSQNKFILLLIAVLLFSGAIVAAFWSNNRYDSQPAQNFINSGNSNNSQNNSIQNSSLANSVEIIANSKNSQNTNKKITNAEFTKHFKKDDCWVSFEKKVYNVTTYLAIHPGGSNKIERFCSKEIDPVSASHSGGPFGSIKLQDILAPFYVGDLVE